MARPRRNLPAGTVVHVVNRAVDRREIFHSDRDYWAFVDLLQEAAAKGWVIVIAYCIMPNHWHLVLKALSDDGVSKFMQWLTGTHVRRYRLHHKSIGHGHLYQDRFKPTVIEDEAGFLRAMRYVEANAARAGLTRWSDDWPWSSGFERRKHHRKILGDPPFPLPENWGKLLHEYVDAHLANRNDQREE